MKKLLRVVAGLLLLTLPKQAFLQSYVFNYQVNVVENGITYANAFAGGLNNPQFYPVDIDQDGDQDLFVFDRAGSTILVFTNTDGNYAYWYQYAAIFPTLENWVVLTDYNCDALPDIVTGFEDGIKTYKASWTGFTLTYTEDVPKLDFVEAGFTFELPVGYIDLPGIADMDSDGDMDVLTFNMTGGVVDYYKNQAVENGESCGTWSLEHVEGCWGNFYESGITYSVELDYSCKGVTTARENVHAGSTFMIFDEDADGDKDLVLGDLAFGVLNRLVNGGDAFYGDIVDQDTTFPSYDKPYDVPLFPAAFLLDVDHDGLDDMLVSPNSVNSSESRKNVWYYKNVSTDDTYVFDYQTDTFLVETMIDLGDGSYPAFFDYNNDGLLDIIVGNFGYYVDGDDIGQLALFENTGTATNPAYTLVDRNFGGLSDFGFNGICPTFADLDGDGDDDMLIGESTGNLHFFKNIAAPGNPASFVLFTANYQGIRPGNNSTPCFADVSGDGLPDLLVGEQNGNVNYYENTGTIAAPIFTLQNEFWGNIDVRLTGTVTGYSAPFVYTSPAGNFVYVGCQDGTIYRYLPTADFSGAFTEETTMFSQIESGAFTTVSVADINADGLPEMVIGNKRGGLQLFRDASAVNLVEQTLQKLTIYPNPAQQTIMVQLPSDIPVSSCLIQDLQGRTISLSFVQEQQQVKCSVADLASGMYYIFLNSSDQQIVGYGSFIKI